MVQCLVEEELLLGLYNYVSWCIYSDHPYVIETYIEVERTVLLFGAYS